MSLSKLLKLLKLLKNGVIFLLVILTIAAPVTSFATKTIKAGYYNLATLQQELPEYRQLQELLKQKKAELETLRGNLYREYQLYYQEAARKLEDETKGKSPEEKSSLEKSFHNLLQQKISAINRQIEEKQQEIDRFQSEKTAAVLENLKKLIATVATKKKLDLVVEKNNIFYGDNDITQLIISQAKKEAGKKTPTPPAVTPSPAPGLQ
ncbi:MAG: OmpH family outer membrane protein [Firmicutes bacterium]|nr:OmpH family outer membrane protein [Bacillota bacterium]